MLGRLATPLGDSIVGLLGALPSRGVLKLEAWQVDALDGVLDEAAAAHAAAGEHEVYHSLGGPMEGKIHQYTDQDMPADEKHWELQLQEQERRDAMTAASLEQAEQAEALIVRLEENADTEEALRQQVELEAEERARLEQEERDGQKARELQATLEAEDKVEHDGFVRVPRGREEREAREQRAREQRAREESVLMAREERAREEEVREERARQERARQTEQMLNDAQIARALHEPLRQATPLAPASRVSAPLPSAAPSAADLVEVAAPLSAAPPITGPKHTIVIDSLNVGRSWNVGFSDPSIDVSKRLFSRCLCFLPTRPGLFPVFSPRSLGLSV